MAFPTIPTVAASRVLTNVQADTNATRVSPNLDGLTINAGDRLIAICIAYQTSTGTNAAFSGWTNGFTERHDSSTSTTMAIGIAEKIADGTETGTISVTQAGTITGHACWILLSIAGAHDTTPIEVGGRASSTAATMADPTALNPTGWDAEDTLWIAVHGDGETSLTGSYTGVASAPTNYTDYVDTGISADAIGGVEGAVAFRQVNAASEDAGAFTADSSNSRHAAVLIAVRPSAAATVPGAPTGVTAAQTANTHELDVDWSAPASDGGATITGYNLRWSSNGGTDWTEDGVEVGLTRLVTGLAVLPHIFQAAAVNSVGQGAWSSSSTAVTPNPWQTFSEGTSSSTGATVTGLTNDTVDYEFRVAAVNSEGQGAWSNIAGPYTPTQADTVPDAISDLAGTPGNTEVALTHSAPADGGSTITDYVYEYRESGTGAPAGLRYPVERSGRKWLDQDGYPYLLKCTALWSAPQNGSNADITTVLEDLADLGFNSFKIMLFGYRINGDFIPFQNAAGEPVFATAVNGSVSSTAYQSELGAAWYTVDHIVDEAERLGLTVVMSLYSAFASTGPKAEIEAAHTADSNNLYNFGFDVATRYAAYSNIVWDASTDDNITWGSTLTAAIDKFAQGVLAAEGTTHRLWLSENNNGATAYSQWPSAFTGSGGFTYLRLDANSVYQYGNATVDQFDASYTQSGATSFPVWDCEPPYMGNTSQPGAANRQQVRERCYGTFFRGGIGLNMGHEDLWPFGPDSPFATEGLTYLTVLANSIYIPDVARAWDLIDIYCPDTTWVPDGGTFLTTGLGTGDTKAASGFSETAALAYFPDSRTIQVDTTVISGTANVRLRWYDPTNGSYTTIAASEAQQSGRSITHPGNNSAGTGDWVLVVDLADGSSGSQPGAWQSFSDGTSATPGTTVTGLTNGVDYDFRAAAVNAIGQAAWSNIAGPYMPTVLERLKRWTGATWEPVVMKHGAAWATVVTKTM